MGRSINTFGGGIWRTNGGEVLNLKWDGKNVEVLVAVKEICSSFGEEKCKRIKKK